jgi:hypothetical protein
LWAYEICEEEDSRDQSPEEGRALATFWILRIIEKQARSGCKKLLELFSVQADKRGYREDE